MGWRMLLFAIFSVLIIAARSQTSGGDAEVMQDLRKSLNTPIQLGWVDSNPCKWKSVECDGTNRVIWIRIGHQNLQGFLPPNLNNLTMLQILEVQGNQLTGSLPSFAGLSSLQMLLLNNNNFTSIPPDFFNGMNSLQAVYLDYNPFSSWTIPDGIKSASTLQVFSATCAGISGPLPDFFGSDAFASLTTLHLAFNNLEGPLPSTLSGSSIQSMWLNGNKLNGSITVLQNMTQLTQVWLHGNMFSGPLPDLTSLVQLKDLSLRDNSLTGPVPTTLLGLKTLEVVNLTNNLLQGEYPRFGGSVRLDANPTSNSFCLPNPGVPCDSRVTTLLHVVQDFGYPETFARNWKQNDPCNNWRGISCNNGNISVVNFSKMGLSGTISASFAQIASLEKLILANNNLTGTIPNELTNLPNLSVFDVSNNQIYGKVPSFRNNVLVTTTGNSNIGKDGPPPSAPHSGPPSSVSNGSESTSGKKRSLIGIVVGSIVGVFVIVCAVQLSFYICMSKNKQSRIQSPYNTVMHPRHSGSDDTVTITIAGDLPIVESGLVISIQVLRNMTNNFSEHNILGRGGFGTVYKGELHDGTRIAVKRMESRVMGLDEFKSEIAVLTKVRHRHLVSLMGYCLDGSERMLVYEYMPQGTLSRFLFHWREEDVKPLEWKKRLIVALDVARGVEYLHGLAHQSFIHRDLKPSNILLGDNMRAKVADFGLVRLAPAGQTSITATTLSGTFGYLAPEYAGMGRVSTKIDVFSFGVILMEIITGRKALDERMPVDTRNLLPLFKKMLNKKEIQQAIDPTLDISNEETFASINIVAELAGHCTANDPSQRPDMGHAVNVLSSLAELWKPTEVTDPEDLYEIDPDMTLPEALKKWLALEDNTQTSIPTRPFDSFTDGR